MNISKTKHMIVGHEVQYQERDVEDVREYNYPGEELDSALTMKRQICDLGKQDENVSVVLGLQCYINN